MHKLNTDNINDIISYIDTVGSDSVKYFGGVYEGGYCIEQRPSEIAELIQLLSAYPMTNYLEIGAAAMGSVRLFSDYFDIKNITIVDLPYEKVLKERAVNLQYLKENFNVKCFDGDSTTTEAKEFIHTTDLTYDVIFIDGDHSYSSCKNDIEIAIDVIKNMGLICLHDTLVYDGVKQVMGEYLSRDDITLIKNISIDKGIGVLQYISKEV